MIIIEIESVIIFSSRFWNRGESRLKYWLYKVAMLMYVLQNSIFALLGSTIATYKVLTVTEPQPNVNKTKPGPKSVVALMLMIVNNGFRYFVADFFLSKIFDEQLDVLGGKTVEESIGTGNDEEQDKPERSSNRIPTPTQNLQEVIA